METGVTAQKLARMDWIAASEFHDVSEAEVFERIEKRIRDEKANSPIVLFDLDSTLYDVGPRTHQIIREWLDSSESRKFPHVSSRLHAMEDRHIDYSIQDIFIAMDLSFEHQEVGSAWKSLKKFWSRLFFTDDYLFHDRPYSGALQQVARFHEMGAKIVYLTAREQALQGKGTVAKLKEDGFPIDFEGIGRLQMHQRTALFMKPHSELVDSEFKTETALQLRKFGKLVASFENEPLNFVSLLNAFPDAIHVFVETVCSDRKAAVCESAYRVRKFN